MSFKDLTERVENLRDSYHYGDKERILDDVAKSFDDGVITEDQAVALFTQVYIITLKAFD